MLRLASILLPLVLLAGCGESPRLVDTLGSAMDQTNVLFTPDFRLLAPTIIVATVLENRIVSRSVPAARMPKVFLDLREVRARKENSLRRDVPAEFTFYYFIQSPYSPQNNPRYKFMFQAEPGRRYIFFLARENGVLRSIGDVGEYSLRIRSGAHPDFQVPEVEHTPDSEVAAAIAELLLTIGEDPELDGLAFHLRSEVALLDNWNSRFHNFQLLRRLLAAPEPVRAAACTILAEYYGYSDCLLDLRDDPTESEEVRESMRELAEKIGTRDDSALRMLEQTGATMFPAVGRVDSRRQILDELRIQLFSSDSRLREAACSAILLYFPGDDCAPIR